MPGHRGMIERMLWLLGHIGLGIAIAALLIWLFQGRLLFYPTRTLTATPAQWGLDYRDVHLAAADGIPLHGWLIPAGTDAGKDRYTLLFLHGNAGNISHRGASIVIFHRLGLDVMIIDYRGYGRSNGRPSEPGLYADADAAWRWLVGQRGVPPHRIIVFGRSLGGAVAARLAATRSDAGTPPTALIVESSFTDVAALARHHYPGLAHLVPLRFRFPAEEWIRQVRAPVLILHSPEDEIVPFENGRRLFDAAPHPKTFMVLQGGHNDGFLLSQPSYQAALADFLATLADASAAPGLNQKSSRR